jgi:hypothetical protein
MRQVAVPDSHFEVIGMHRAEAAKISDQTHSARGKNFPTQAQTVLDLIRTRTKDTGSLLDVACVGIEVLPAAGGAGVVWLSIERAGLSLVSSVVLLQLDDGVVADRAGAVIVGRTGSRAGGPRHDVRIGPPRRCDQ